MSYYIMEQIAKDRHADLIKEAEKERLISQLPKKDRKPYRFEALHLAPYMLAAIALAVVAASALA